MQDLLRVRKLSATIMGRTHSRVTHQSMPALGFSGSAARGLPAVSVRILIKGANGLQAGKVYRWQIVEAAIMKWVHLGFDKPGCVMGIVSRDANYLSSIPRLAETLVVVAANRYATTLTVASLLMLHPPTEGCSLELTSAYSMCSHAASVGFSQWETSAKSVVSVLLHGCTSMLRKQMLSWESQPVNSKHCKAAK